MARIIVFNNDTNRMENYYRNENEAMPYNANRTLKDHGKEDMVHKVNTTQELRLIQVKG